MILEDVSSAVLALNPQEALLEGDWEKIRRIPRTERRIVHIDSIETSYLYDQPAPLALWTGGGGVQFAGSAAAAGAGGMGMGGPMGGMGMGGPMGMDMGGPMGMDMGGPMGGGMGGPMGMGMGQAAAVTGPENPTFEITLRGYTPYFPNTAQFLEKGLVQWLKDSSLLPTHRGRRYRIRPDSRGIESITSAMDPATTSGRTGTGRERSGVIPGLTGQGRSGGMGGAGRGGRTAPTGGGMRTIGGATGNPMMGMDMGGPMGMDMGGPGGAGVGGPTGGGFFGNRTTTSGSNNPLAFLPQPPDGDESRERDQAFVIIFRVELLPAEALEEEQNGDSPQAGDTVPPTDNRRSRTDERPGMAAWTEDQS
jgi:hypothetical protein